MPKFTTYRRSDIVPAYNLKWYNAGYSWGKLTRKDDYENGYEIVQNLAGYPPPGGKRVEAKEYFMGGFHDGFVDRWGKANPRCANPNVIPSGKWITAQVKRVGNKILAKIPGRSVRNPAGAGISAGGVFHPFRDWPGYSPAKAGEGTKKRKKATTKKRKGAVAKYWAKHPVAKKRKTAKKTAKRRR